MIIESENIRLFQLWIAFVEIVGLMDMDFQSGYIRFVDYSNIGMRVAQERNKIRRHFKSATGKEKGKY